MKNLSKTILTVLFTSQFAIAQSATDMPVYLEPIYNDLKNMQSQKTDLFAVWTGIRAHYSKADQALIDAWVLTDKNAGETTPRVETTLVKQADGEKSLRATFNFKNKSVSYDLSSSLTNDEMTINKKTLGELSSNHISTFVNNLSNGSASDRVKLSQTIQVLDQETLKKMSYQERAYYELQERLLLELSQKVLTKDKKASRFQFQNILFLLAMQNARAGSSGKCFNQLGYIVSLDASGNCPNTVDSSSYSQIQCANGGQLCNPKYYGVNRTDSSQGLCLTSADLIAQKTCGTLSPLNSADDVKSLISSMMKVRPEGEKPSGRGAGGSPQEEVMKQALAACEDSGLNASAQCAELMSRKVAMNGFMVDMKSKGQGRPDRDGAGPGADRREMASRMDDSSYTSSSSSLKASAASCSIFCTLGSWLTSDTAIKSYLTLGGVALGYFLGNKAGKKKVSAASSSVVTYSNGTTNTGTVINYGTPVAPTTPDYSGVAQ